MYKQVLTYLFTYTLSFRRHFHSQAGVNNRAALFTPHTRAPPSKPSIFEKYGIKLLKKKKTLIEILASIDLRFWREGLLSSDRYGMIFIICIDYM